MQSPEGRVAFLEGRIEEHGHVIDGIRGAVVSLEQRMDRRFEGIDRRFEAIDRRFETIDHRFEELDGKMSRQFMWLVGIQVTTLVAIVAALVAR